MQVSIGGHPAPFTTTSAKPVFASDLTGAEWTVTPDVRAGAVVLVLTAPDQSGSDTIEPGAVEAVTIANPGSGYAAVPGVTFEAAPAGGTTATGTAVASVDAVTVGTAGSGYASVPSVTFSAPPSGGTTATGAAAGPGGVTSVTIGNRGDGYTSAPTVTFGAAPSGGTTATGTATLRSEAASVTITNRGERLHVCSNRNV